MRGCPKLRFVLSQSFDPQVEITDDFVRVTIRRPEPSDDARPDKHVDRPERTLAEIKRCLAGAGYAIIEVPTETWLWKAAWSIWTRIGPGRAWRHAHVVDFSGDLLERLVKEAGFKMSKRSTFMGMLRAFVITPA